MISFTIPMKAPSAPNLREHWAPKAKRTKAQRTAARRRAPRWTQGPLLVIRLVRIGRNNLDDDNVQGAMKAIRDGVADWLRIDDASPLVEWRYTQEKGEPGVRVELTIPSTPLALPTQFN